MNCEQHKKEVAGISDMKVLAEMIGDLHYETLKEFMFRLADKFFNDGYKDISSERKKLGDALFEAAIRTQSAAREISAAWQISKPFMKSENMK